MSDETNHEKNSEDKNKMIPSWKESFLQQEFDLDTRPNRNAWEEYSGAQSEDWRAMWNESRIKDILLSCDDNRSKVDPVFQQGLGFICGLRTHKQELRG